MSTAPRSLRSETSLTSFAVSVGPRGPRGPRRCCGSRPHFRWLIYVKLGSSFLMNSSPKWPFLLEPYDVLMVKSRHFDGADQKRWDFCVGKRCRHDDLLGRTMIICNVEGNIRENDDQSFLVGGLENFVIFPYIGHSNPN